MFCPFPIVSGGEYLLSSVGIQSIGSMTGFSKMEALLSFNGWSKPRLCVSASNNDDLKSQPIRLDIRL
jgi:hypothetical protein